MKIEFNSLKDLLIFNIKYYRYVYNLSQEKLAEKCNLSARYLTDIERGLHCPTINKIEILAKVFSIEPYMLFKNFDRDEKIIKKMKESRQYNQK